MKSRSYSRCIVRFTAAAGIALVLGAHPGIAQKKSAPAPSHPAPAKSAPASHSSASANHGGGTSSASHPANTAPHANGNTTIRTASGGTMHVRPGETVRPGLHGETRVMDPSGHIRHMDSPTMRADFGRNGHVNAFHVKNGAVSQSMYRGPGGVRIVEGFHPSPMGGGGVRVVSYGARRGFVERPIYGRDGYMRRSYLAGGRRYAVVYRGYRYHGAYFYRPVPAIVYAPGFYGWAVQPWGQPVAIPVGFVGQPWYGAYGTAFVPYQTYASPDQWMTDQMLAQNMQQAYDDGAAAAQVAPGAGQAAYEAPPAAPPTISPELKTMIDQQVKTDVAEMAQAAAAGPGALAPPVMPNSPEEVPEALRPGHTLFRVGMTITAAGDDDSCTLNSNDWVVRMGDIQNDGTVAVRVATSRPSECSKGSVVNIALNDLSSMQNDQDEQMMALVTMLSTQTGKAGMPTGPADGNGGIPVPGGQTSADVQVADLLNKEQIDANGNEAAVTATAAGGGS